MKYMIMGLFALLIAFCNKEEGITIDDNDYLIFGRFYGECLGEECIKMFKLTDGALYEDTSDTFLATEFTFVPLSHEMFKKVKDLRAIIPGRLLNEEEDTFGCPDCADQGGLYIEVSDDGVTNNWRIDQDKSEVPVYLHDFIDRVNEAINEL